jgi:hypothetical protein
MLMIDHQQQKRTGRTRSGNVTAGMAGRLCGRLRLGPQAEEDQAVPGVTRDLDRDGGEAAELLSSLDREIIEADRTGNRRMAEAHQQLEDSAPQTTAHPHAT